MHASIHVPAAVPTPSWLVRLAADFSPRYERHGDRLIVIDASGLDRLIGPPREIAGELQRAATAQGGRVHVAFARTWTTTVILAVARPGVTVVAPGGEEAALAMVPLGVLDDVLGFFQPEGIQTASSSPASPAASIVATLKQWGIRTLGELAALPPSDLAARLGRQGHVCRALARGEELRPLVPDLPEERFESSMALEWPIDGLEPLSFVLTRLLEPLSTRLERRDRGAARLHVSLGLVTRDVHARRLELPSPLRDVRTLRTLALLDLESHPPAASIDRVTVTIDPTPGRVLQHTLFVRPHPTPEQVSTLLARLGALMGQDRIGAPMTIDSHRPGAFELRPFATEHAVGASRPPSRRRRASGGGAGGAGKGDAENDVVSALRRCRQAVPARVATEAGRPVRVTTDRRSFAGGSVRRAAGPWRTSGAWWAVSGQAGQAGLAAPKPCVRAEAGEGGAWHRDEWDVELADGVVYRIFQDRAGAGWFIEGIVD